MFAASELAGGISNFRLTEIQPEAHFLAALQ